MLTRDIPKFMIFFLFYLFAFAVAVQVLLSDGGDITFYKGFTTLYDLFILSTVGDQPEEIAWPRSESEVHLLSVLLIVVYINIIVFLIIVLLNLLIAMMGNTYQKTLEDAILVWRFNYARLVLRMELLMPSCSRWCTKTFAGECEPGAGPHGRDLHFYTFRRVEGNLEGGDTDIFADIHDEAEEEEDAHLSAPSSFRPRHLSTAAAAAPHGPSSVLSSKLAGQPTSSRNLFQGVYAASAIKSAGRSHGALKLAGLIPPPNANATAQHDSPNSFPGLIRATQASGRLRSDPRTRKSSHRRRRDTTAGDSLLQSADL
mmetsp:Transcript_21158/g.54170  ORF Transcript_21158/g.54170 Transcript_21158/m.54170 type:complete len:315 (+) Transcript_21158:187-1131(+)